MIAILSSPESFQNKDEMDKIRDIIKQEGEGIIHYEVKNFMDIGEALSGFKQCDVIAIIIVGGQGISSATFEYLVDKKPFGQLQIPIAVLSGDDERFISQNFGATSEHSSRDLSRILKKHKAGSLLNNLLKTPIIKVEGVMHVGTLYGLYFCTGEIVNRTQMFKRTLYSSGYKQTIQNYMTILSLLYSAFVGSKKSYDINSMIRISRNQRGAMVGRYFMVLLSSLNGMFLGPKFPERKKARTLNFISVEYTKDAIINTCKGLFRGSYGDYIMPGHVITEVEHARLVFNQKFIVDGRLYETEDKGEILISMADDLTFIRLD